VTRLDDNWGILVLTFCFLFTASGTVLYSPIQSIEFPGRRVGPFLHRTTQETWTLVQTRDPVFPTTQGSTRCRPCVILALLCSLLLGLVVVVVHALDPCPFLLLIIIIISISSSSSIHSSSCSSCSNSSSSSCSTLCRPRVWFLVSVVFVSE
jgi:hypothetical protein